jgi:molybdate transport system substrate-binding protein
VGIGDSISQHQAGLIMAVKSIHVLSGGAAMGLSGACAPRFEAQHPAKIVGTFGAVGAMKAKLMDGAVCDVLILTESLIDELTQASLIRANSARSLGLVKTALAVKAGQVGKSLDDPSTLKAALLKATAIYFPDPQLATAGIHFKKVLQQMGIDEQVADRLKTFPNGAAAMNAMARSEDPHVMGCTQATEILITPGVTYAGDLPKIHELATRYVGAVTARSEHPDLAEKWLDVLTDPQTLNLRLKMGFLPD